MKVSELRVGNLIWNPVQEIHVDVTLRELNQIQFENKYDQNPTGINFKWEPITLTEEWLLEFGFFEAPKDRGYNKWYSKKINPITHDYMVTLADSGSHYFYLNGHFIIKYVHQLQNLYFALTGEELKIK